MTSSRLVHIDVWRFIAIGMVIVSHIVAYSHPWYNETMPWLVWRLDPLGMVGVQIFFCISGFVICRGLMREEEKFGAVDMTAFYVRRAYRIFPPLAAYLIFVAGMSYFEVSSITSLQIAQAATFTCNFQSIGTCGWELGHTWSLAHEEQFYMIMPLLFVWLGMARNRQSLWAIGVILVTILVGATAVAAKPIVDYMQHAIYMFAGCACAIYWKELSHRFQSLPVGIWIVAVALIPLVRMVHLPPVVLHYVYPLVLPVVLCIAVFATPISNPIVHRVFTSSKLSHIGRISYGIYLWQQLATADYGFASPLMTFLLLSVVVVLSHFSFHYFELPFIRKGAEYTNRNLQKVAVETRETQPGLARVK